MRIYVSGPMTGHTNLNKPAFDQAAQHLRSRGYGVVSPHDVPQSVEGDTVTATERGAWLQTDILRMASCDAIYLLDGWYDSVGANIELFIAQLVGLQIFDERKGLGEQTWARPNTQLITQHWTDIRREKYHATL